MGAVFLGHQASCLSAVVEDESPAVAKRDLFGLPGGALVEAFRLCAGGVPFLVEPVEVRVVIRDPFLDGLPGWLDLLDGIDVEGRRWRAWKMDDAFPEAVEPEKEFDFLATENLADGLHGALAAGALERVAAPNLEDEVAPEGAHVAGGLFGWRDERIFVPDPNSLLVTNFTEKTPISLGIPLILPLVKFQLSP